MAFKIIWPEQARDDLQSIVLFIASAKPSAAESFGIFLMSKVDVLGQFPLIERAVPEENDETIREIVVRPCRIICKVLRDDQVVAIVRVWHGARGGPEVPSQIKY